MRYLLLAALVAFVMVPSLSRAETDARSAPSVVKAEEYLRSLGMAKARFLQTAQDGSQLIGTFYLSRPGRLRFEYDALDDFIVADGYFLYFYDSDLGEQSNAPIGQTLADFLLRDDLSLSGDVTVKSVRRSDDLLQITLMQTEDPDAGSLTLGFKENPMELKKWEVTDATGAVTEVELFQLESGIDLPHNLFVYSDPKKSEPRYND